jgi:putative transposase
MPQSLEQLDLLLLTVAKGRRIHRDGIRFQGLRYIDLTMATYVGEEVIIRYDPRDMAEIRVYYKNKFLCRAVCQELAGQTVGLKQIIQARDKRRRQLQRTVRDRKALLDLLVNPVVTPEKEESNSPTPSSYIFSPLKRYIND